MRTLMKWLDPERCPLILLPESKILDWQGVEGKNPQMVRSDELSEATDYEVACSVNDEVATLSIGGIDVVVFNDEPSISAWIQADSESGILVRWVYAESEDALAPILSNGDIGEDWIEIIQDILIQESKNVLFPSGYRGDTVSDCLEFFLTPGRYAIQSACFAPDEKTKFLLYRFLKKSGENLASRI